MMDFRMYENELPNEGDIVIVKIISVDDIGAQCELLEYGGMQALLPITEYSRKRIKSIKKIVKPGKRDVLSVIHVDPVKKCIDLSKLHVSPTEIQAASDKFQKSNFVHSILRNVCMQQSELQPQLNIEQMYIQLGWPLYHDFGHAFDGLEQAAKNFEILNKYHLDFKGNVLTELKRSLEHKFQEKSKDVRCIVNVSSVGIDGVNTIKKVLIDAKKQCNDIPDVPIIDITIQSCPDYCISTTGMDETLLVASVQRAIDLIRTGIEQTDGGAFSFKPIEII
jgi:translation initiation factor 2 subunit 1